MQIQKSLQNVVESFISLREGLDVGVVGYTELKWTLVCALLRRALGMKGNNLVFSAPGLAKTTLMKWASQLVANMNGGYVAYDRVQGRPDSTPEEYLSRRRANYDDSGRLYFENCLQTIKTFLAEDVVGLPGFFHLDELDKMPGRAMFGLLQVMEEQQVTVEGLGTKDLNFVMFATANTKKYDPQAQPLPTSVKDRFTSVVELGFLPLEDDVKVLKLVGTGIKREQPAVKHVDESDLLAVRKSVAENGLGGLIYIDDQIIQGCATVTKLTQSKVSGFTEFHSKFKVPAGPRSYIDLLQEAAVMSLLAGKDAIDPMACIKAGCRVYRGRVEMSPEVAMAGETADTHITKILHEVFADMKVENNGGGNGNANPQ